MPEVKIPTHPEVSGTHPEVSGTHPDASGNIRDASGIGTSSAGVCIWPMHPLLACSCSRLAAALRDFVHAKAGVDERQLLKLRGDRFLH